MPSHLHQAFVSILRRRECALELARIVGVPDLPAELWQEVGGGFTDPAGSDELFHADLALVAFRGGDRGNQALAGLILEPQLGLDPSKGVAWPIYWVGLRKRHSCPAWEIVISPSDSVVHWASNRLFAGEPQVPHVIGRDQLPPVLDLARALANPAVAALAASLHARGPHARESAEILIQACTSLPAEDRRCYLRLLYAGMEKATMDVIQPSVPEELKWEITEYEREGGWFINGLTEGRAEGHLGGKRDALFLAIEARGLTLTDEQRSMIEGCAEEAQLDRWLLRLFRVDSAEALLAPDAR